MAGSALAGAALPHAHAAEDNTIRLALIGSGSRGSGAVANAFESPNGPCKLVAMADIFPQQLEGSHKALSTKFPTLVDVPPERRFVGFEAYKKAIDCLRPGIDIAMLTTYPAFRPVHLDYAVAKGVNVFMEKSFAVDAPGVRRVIKAGELAKQKNLKIAAGLMGRAAMHMGRIITWEEMLKSTFELCPGIDHMNENSPPPVQPDANGFYPVPVPGQWKEI